MSDPVAGVVTALVLVALAVAAAARLRVGVARDLAVAAARATVQLAVVGAVVVAVFEVEPLAVAFVAVMAATAAVTAGGRLHGVPGARRRAAVAIAVPALLATAVLLAVGAFAATPRAAVPTAGILLGGALAATSLTGRRLLDELEDAADEAEARLCLGDGVREALAPAVRRAVRTGLVPVVDQTRSVGLVTLPGTFVGLLLGGASPAEAAATQLVVLLSLLAVELAAAVLVAELVVRAVTAPGERVELPG